MVLNQLDPFPMDDDSTVHGAMTPPETVATFLDEQDPLTPFKPTSSVPWPGSTFIIRSAESGQVLTLVDGQLILASPGGRGSIHWACVETKGWLGFRNTVSGRYLGHDNRGKLRCVADRHQAWENFCARLTPDGGYILQMTHFERLWKVGMQVERGKEMLAKVGEGRDDGIVWEFVKV
ncbi:uncharacterized protein PAC_07640 [Phialocephala subalpina]|uniref:Uncharacterized protein n=1 Tax=Phialocephala subalpina TaxID=576137 RepID=A0A1L7WY99_9HELO|nr:uncharacterized protein PAC_07640 [Phialocephala subalpina]